MILLSGPQLSWQQHDQHNPAVERVSLAFLECSMQRVSQFHRHKMPQTKLALEGDRRAGSALNTAQDACRNNGHKQVAARTDTRTKELGKENDRREAEDCCNATADKEDDSEALMLTLPATARPKAAKKGGTRKLSPS